MMGYFMLSSCVGATTGHPLWHLFAIAAAASAVFVGIKTHELWQRRQDSRGLSESAAPRRLLQRDAAVMIVATLSMAAAAVHANVTGEHFGEAFAYGVFFLACACLQGASAIAIAMHPSRKLLWCAIALNVSVVCVWTLTRSIGLPIGPNTWQPEPISAVDLLCTLVEGAIVVGAARTLQRMRTPAGEQTRTIPASVARLLADSGR
jgi:hypothetical protein